MQNILIVWRLIMNWEIRYLFITIFFTTTISLLSATNYYVATSYGNDSNNGTSLTTPYKTIAKAASVMSAGDICYIRQGRYREAISISNLSGSNGSPIVFTNYNSERVIIDGTTAITTAGTIYQRQTFHLLSLYGMMPALAGKPTTDQPAIWRMV